ncbi:HNH endonuclease [Allopusillimonas ginsengisoli]|uniref:HNH endonuclease n=1 Tax=Allopusillimonas ginsengisoli TaxID=453575 RepID=UPI00101FA756|nr:HNH endonuclease [Allopusillimonas ginsengisoli]TEA78656.1 HNH endonuclease [Allopusillimonas ginsengisoli]
MSLNLQRQAYAEHHVKFDCEHENTIIRRRQIKNGAFQYTHQCLRCGEPVGNPIAKVKAEAMHGGPVPDWDVALQEDWEQRRQLSAQAASKAGEAEFWENYNAYLQSDEWKEKRRLVLERDNHLCQGCRRRNATQVHHLTYKHVGRELLFELISICDKCHEVAHDDSD